MKTIDLTHTLFTGMAQYPDDPTQPSIRHDFTHLENGFQGSSMVLSCHVGTHIDTPLHFLDGPPGLEAMPVDRFCGPCRVVDAPASDPPSAIPYTVLEGLDIETVEYLVFRTGWEQHWGTPRYYEMWPYFSMELAERLAQGGLKGVGLDTPSLDERGDTRVHGCLAAAGLINVENLAHLSSLPTGLFDFMVFPLKLTGSEASPVRAVAVSR